MITRSEYGSTPIALAIIIAVVAGAGFAAWRVWDNDKQNDTAKSSTTITASGNTATQSSPKSDKTTPSLPNGFTQYTNKTKGVSIAYPRDWTADKVQPIADRKDSFAIFATQDYEKGNLGIGGEGVLRGISVTVSSTTARGTDVQQDYDYKDPKFGTDVTNFTIGGEKALRYYFMYEGQVYSRAITYRNGIEYNFFMDYTMDDSLGYSATRQKYEPIFLQMLETFHLD